MKTILCTRAFSVSAAATTVDDSASPPGSTELDDEAGHNCKMSHDSYKSFARLVLGLYHDTWVLHRTGRAFRNLIIQDLDKIMYYWDTNIYNINCKPMSYMLAPSRASLCSSQAPAHVHHASSPPYGEKMKLLALLSVAHEAIYHSFVANFSPSRKWQ